MTSTQPASWWLKHKQLWCCPVKAHMVVCHWSTVEVLWVWADVFWTPLFGMLEARLLPNKHMFLIIAPIKHLSKHKCFGISRMTCDGLSSHQSCHFFWGPIQTDPYLQWLSDHFPIAIPNYACLILINYLDLGHENLFPSIYHLWLVFRPDSKNPSAQVQRAARGSRRVVVQNVVPKLSIWVQSQGWGYPTVN